MEYKQAFELLRGPLRFGDEQQIAARKFLQAVDAARTRLCYCLRCKGEGIVRSGKYCSCVADEPADVLHALGLAGKMRVCEPKA